MSDKERLFLDILFWLAILMFAMAALLTVWRYL